MSLLSSLAYLALVPLNLKSDVLDLLLSDSGERSELLVAKSLMSAGVDQLRLGIVSDSLGATESAAEFVKLAIKDSKGLLNLKKISRESFLERYSASRAFLLDQETLSKISSDEAVSFVTENIQRKLSSPLGAFYSSLLPYDPLLLSTESVEVLSGLSEGEENRNVLYQVGEGESRAFIFIETDSVANTPEQIAFAVAKIGERLEAEHPEVELRWSGFARFASDSAERLKKDINRVAFFASLLIVLFVFLTFRRLEPLLLTGLSLVSGFIFGLAATHSMLGGVHLMTIGFGSSLMGAGADYAVHFQSSKYFSGSGRLVRRAILLGAWTSIMAFVFLMVAGFPGLTELALFSACSLLGSSATVLLFFKDAIKTKLDYRNTFFSRILAKLPFTLIGKASSKFTLLAITVTGGVLCFLLVEFEDSPASFQKPSAVILEDELWLQKNLVPKNLDGYLLVSGETEEALESHLLKLAEEIKGKNLAESVVSKTSVTGDKIQRVNSYKAYKNFIESNRDELVQGLEYFGFSEELVNKALEISNQREPTLSSSSEVYPGELLQELVLEETSEMKWGAAYLYKVSDKANLLSYLEDKENARFYNHRETLVELFFNYRIRAMICLAVAYLIIFIFLVLVYDFSKAARIISPAIAGGIITVAAVSLLGFSLNFFGVLALVIVLGLAVDYAIFLSEAEDERSVSNIAITLSVFTTTGSFGLLMLSKTPVLAMFGAVISLGVIISWLLLPMVFQNSNTGS